MNKSYFGSFYFFWLFNYYCFHIKRSKGSLCILSCNTKTTVSKANAQRKKGNASQRNPGYALKFIRDELV